VEGRIGAEGAEGEATLPPTVEHPEDTGGNLPPKRLCSRTRSLTDIVRSGEAGQNSVHFREAPQRYIEKASAFALAPLRTPLGDVIGDRPGCTTDLDPRHYRSSCGKPCTMP
jgi:hypothetical protein